MAFQPWYVGDTYPALQIPLNIDGNTPDNITGLSPSSFKMIIRNLSTGLDTTGTGTFSIVTYSPAVINYQFSDADTRIGTTTNLFIEATFPNPGGGLAVYDPISFAFTAD